MRVILAFLALTVTPLLVHGDPPDAPASSGGGAKVLKDDKGAKPASDGNKDSANEKERENLRDKLNGYRLIYAITTDPDLRNVIAERIKALEAQQPKPAPQPQHASADAAEAKRLAAKKNAYALLEAMGVGGLFPEVLQNEQTPPPATPPKELTPEEKKKQQLKVYEALFGPGGALDPFLNPPAVEPPPRGPRTDSREYERSKSNY